MTGAFSAVVQAEPITLRQGDTTLRGADRHVSHLQRGPVPASTATLEVRGDGALVYAGPPAGAARANGPSLASLRAGRGPRAQSFAIPFTLHRGSRTVVQAFAAVYTVRYRLVLTRAAAAERNGPTTEAAT